MDQTLDRSIRFEKLAALPEMEAGMLAARALRTAGGGVSVVVPPTVGMFMARAMDGAKGETFNLAEVLVTEARVSVDGHEGWGLVLGRHPDHALSVAIADASAEASEAARTEVERTLAAQAVVQRESLEREWEDLAPTMVDFEISRG